MTKRLTEEIDNKFPEEQFGFRKGRNTIQAIKNLIDDIEDAIRHPRGKFHAVFIDFTKAFDGLNRIIISSKLDQMVERNKELAVMTHNMLRNNFVRITDNVSTSHEITQTNGVLQGDPLSPLLFNVATHDAVQAIRKQTKDLKVYMYADDMVVGSHNLQELQIGINALGRWADENELQINSGKTEHMVFRKGGRLSSEDKVYLKEELLQTVNSFKYLGLTLQSTAHSFRIHMVQRAAAATKAIYDIRMITRISLKSAMALFEMKIIPILTYGIQLTWESLSNRDLICLENVKARFLKAALGVSKYTKSRLVYELAGETFLMEDLRMKLDLPSTHGWKKLMEDRESKRKEIWAEFYTTEAMLNRSWTGTNQELRHFVTSMAIHGYHHKLCKSKCFHDPGQDCVCDLCDKYCDRYHVLTCEKRSKSIIDYCTKL